MKSKLLLASLILAILATTYITYHSLSQLDLEQFDFEWDDNGDITEE